MTSVEGTEAAVMQSMRLDGPEERRLIVLSNIHPLLVSSLAAISKNFAIVKLADSTNTSEHTTR